MKTIHRNASALANERAERLIEADPILRLLKMAMIALSIGIVVLIVKIAPDWLGKTEVWRVHNIPMLSTQHERDEVKRGDAFRAQIDSLTGALKKAY